MSFFNKLKSKLFKSSSKLEEGLDAIVEDGGTVEEEPQSDVAVAAEAEAEVQVQVHDAPESEPVSEPEKAVPEQSAPDEAVRDEVEFVNEPVDVAAKIETPEPSTRNNWC